MLDLLEDRTLLSTSIPLNSATWTAVGPQGITTSSRFGDFVGVPGPTAGRISGLAGDPTNPNIVYIAAAGGGVWKTVNGGTNWTPLTDTLSTLFMGSVAVAPSNPQVVYAGTGEANNSGDSFYGRGILKSTDGGTTWTLTGSSLFDRKAVAEIAISSTDPNTAYAAVTSSAANGTSGGSGIYKTTDGGATWANTTAGVAATAGDQWCSVVIDPSNPLILYAADGSPFGAAKNGVYKSIDGGSTWNAAGNFPVGASNGRIELAIGKSNPRVLLASVSDPATSALKYLQKSTDAGATWTNLSSVPNYLGQQGWYDNTVAIDPNNDQVFYAAGCIDYNRNANEIVTSRDGGNTWSDLTRDSTGATPHTDFHASGFDASGRLLVGNDGGIWRLNNATPGATVWRNLNNNLQITQFTYAALDPNNDNIMIGGAQDNGTSKFNDNTRWTMVQGGDGGYVAIDPSNSQTLYAEFYGISLTRSDDGGLTFQSVTTGINASDPSNFYVHFTLDPSNPSRLYYGTNKLYVSNNRGNSWTALTTPNQNGWSSSSVINWTAVAKSDPRTIYSTTADGNVFVSTNGGANWAARSPAPGSSFQQILVDPNNAQTAYIVKNVFGGGHIYKTTDAGVTWSDISGNLPNIPAWSVAVDTRAASNRIYIGTDSGVFYTADGGTTWGRFKSGMPNAQVVTLELNTSLNILMAATHGRGSFEIQASDAVSVLPTPVTGATEGIALTDVQVARFNDSPTLLAPDQYTATIDWGDGSPTDTVTPVDLGGGFYGVNGSHTYTVYGTYKVTVSVTGTNGHSGVGSQNLVVSDAPLTPAGLTFTSVEGSKYTGAVGTFTDANPFGNASEFAASIDWGDGKVTQGVITPLGNSVYQVSGSNTYKVFGTYPVKISITEGGGSTTTINSTANVLDAAITATPKTFTGIEGTSFSTTVASFTDADPNTQLSYFDVTVSWGDGTQSFLGAGATIVNRGTRYDVQASHTYARFGSYTVAVQVDSVGGSTSTANSTANVSDAPISAQPNSFITTMGVTFNGQVAVITDSNPYGVATDYTTLTTIDWGDGTTPTAPTAVVDLGGGKFGVQGAHLYTSYGNYVVNVVAQSDGGSKAVTFGGAQVLDSPLSVQAVAPLSATAGQTVSGKLADFTVAYAGAPLSNYTATIDWGDGTGLDTGTVAGGAGAFTVSGGHVYAKAQTYPVTITVNSAGGASNNDATKAVIADPPVNVQMATIPQLSQGSNYAGTVATFNTGTPGNSLAQPSDYIAQIDWGDGKTTGGLLTPVGGGVFNVATASPHVYDYAFNYTVNVTVVSLGGNRGTASTGVTVTPALINGVPGNPIQSTAGTLYSGVVGTFSQYYTTPATDFVATIDWGDGTSSVGTVASTPAGTFTVSADHVFKTYGLFQPQVTVTNPTARLQSVFTVPATVDDVPLDVAPRPVSGVQGQAYSGVVATFTSPNLYTAPGEFNVTIDWGDGSPATAGQVTGGSGNFVIRGTHTYASAAASLPVSVLIAHVGNGPGGTTAAASTTAHVLRPLSGAMTRSSDTGVSTTDGITRDNTPTFAGQGEPNSTVTIYAGGRALGKATVDAAGNWAVTVSTLADGSYAFTATMADVLTGATVQSLPMVVTPTGGLVLTVATSGATVTGVVLNPTAGRLVVTLNSHGAGLNTAGLLNAANYKFGQVNGAVVSPLATRVLSVTPAAGGQTVVTLGVGMGRRSRVSSYVVTLNAPGLTDLAGNILQEKYFVTFPQATNVPNPNYVAKITVTGNTASAPQLYVSLPEQIAANNYSKYSQANKTVRVPKVVVPQPSRVRRTP